MIGKCEVMRSMVGTRPQVKERRFDNVRCN